MSTQILVLTGEVEIPNPHTQTSSYIPQDVYFLRFAGGQRRGTSLQITLGNGGYVQLDNEQTKRLIQALRGAYE